MPGRESAGLRAVLWGITIVVLLGVAAWFVPVNYVAFAPGMTGNLARMVRVANGRRFQSGRLLMVAISVIPLNALLYAYTRLNPVYAVWPRSAVLPDMNFQQYIQLNYAMMDQSQSIAAVEGERLAGLKARIIPETGAVVAGILKGGSAAGHLHIGDRLVKVGSYTVNPYSLRQVMGHFRVGETVPFTLYRKGQRLVVRLRLGRLSGDPDPAIGVVVAQAVRYVIPRPVHFLTSNIGGPSAGMMFSLEIYQQITGRNLARGRIVAGTGEILPGGQVGPIGGVGQKVVTVAEAGARIFLCPASNYAAAESMAQRLGLHIHIYPVKTLGQALSDLEASS
jgi:PDZ domain-containing protein